MNVEELKTKLYEKLRPSGWHNVLKGFILSQDFEKIILQLYKESQESKKFTPVMSQMFRNFYECPYDKLKVVLCGQDPYSFLFNGKPVADGIPFSCSNSLNPQPSLKFIHQEIKETVYPEADWTGPLDLKVWANQGVLLQNIALTTQVGKTGSHYLLWKPFTLYLLDYLSWHNGGLVWVFMGKKPQEYMGAINDNCYKLICSHPASAAHRNDERWVSGDLFNKINSILERNNQSKIIW